MVGCGYGVLAVDTAGFVCDKGGASCEAVDDGGQGGAIAVAEEELGRSIKGWKLLIFMFLWRMDVIHGWYSGWRDCGLAVGLLHVFSSIYRRRARQLWLA